MTMHLTNCGTETKGGTTIIFQIVKSIFSNIIHVADYGSCGGNGVDCIENASGVQDRDSNVIGGGQG